MPVRDSSGHVVSKQPVDLCTDTGTAAGTPVPLPNKSSAHCLVDGDCKEGEWCRLDAGAEEASRISHTACIICAVPACLDIQTHDSADHG